MALQARSALVTGVTEPGGLGYEVASALLGAGAETVVLTGRDAARGPGLVQALDPAGSKVRYLTADLRSPDDIAKLIVDAGHVDLLVNVAATLAPGSTRELSLTGFDEMFAVNVRAPHQLVAGVVPSMIANGGGNIVNISSIGAKLGTAGRAAYAASKAALESLTRSWGVEFAEFNIRVNAVAPGPMHGPRLRRAAGDEAVRQAGKSVPLGRTVGPEEIAKAVVFLASDDASYSTGATLAMDGGRTVV